MLAYPRLPGITAQGPNNNNGNDNVMADSDDDDCNSDKSCDDHSNNDE